MIDEKFLLPVLASVEASSMWQIPQDVHLLVACLGRLQVLSPVFASQLANSAEGTRRWAAENLDSLWPEGRGRYLGPLSIEYEIRGDGRRVSIAGRVRDESDVEPEASGSHIITGYPPAWETACRRSEAKIRAFVDESTFGLGNDAPSGMVVVSVLLGLMDKQDIQRCLASISDSKH